jgi:hypothetical protein
VPSAVLAHTQVLPGPHEVNVEHVSPVQPVLVQAAFMQTLDAH